MLTRQLHRTSLKEGRLPNCLFIGADNTPKEAKNGTLINWGIWLLCVLRSTNLKEIEFQYPLVGHTHGSLDRFFSRLIVALRGRTYFTLADLEAVSKENLKSFAINWSHHGSSYDWVYIRKLLALEFHRYRNVHAFRISLDAAGIWVKWKQFVSDDSWSTPLRVIESDKLPVLERSRPPLTPHGFGEKEQSMHMSFLDKLDTWTDNCL